MCREVGMDEGEVWRGETKKRGEKREGRSSRRGKKGRDNDELDL